MSVRLPEALLALCWLVFLGLPLVLVWTVLSGGIAPRATMAAFPDLALAAPPSQAMAALVFAVGLAPWIAAMAALWHAQALFRLYGRGEALSEAAAQRIGRIGAWLVAAAALGVASRTLQILLLSLTNPPGGRMLSIQIDSGVLGYLLAGGLLVVIGQSTAEAARAVEENRTFV